MVFKLLRKGRKLGKRYFNKIIVFGFFGQKKVLKLGFMGKGSMTCF